MSVCDIDCQCPDCKIDKLEANIKELEVKIEEMENDQGWQEQNITIVKLLAKVAELEAQVKGMQNPMNCQHGVIYSACDSCNDPVLMCAIKVEGQNTDVELSECRKCKRYE